MSSVCPCVHQMSGTFKGIFSYQGDMLISRFDAITIPGCRFHMYWDFIAIRYSDLLRFLFFLMDMTLFLLILKLSFHIPMYSMLTF